LPFAPLVAQRERKRRFGALLGCFWGANVDEMWASLTFGVFYQATFALFCTPKDTCRTLPQSQPLALSATTRSQKVKVKKVKIASPCSDKCRLLKLLGNFS
jgi:hypothetical protein